jgi:iron complex transport system ATP-binding protein
VAAGLLAAQGEVLWLGRSLTDVPMLERGRLAAWVPQEAHFEFGFPVRSVVAQGRYAHGDDDHGVEAALDSLDLRALATARSTACRGASAIACCWPGRW